MAPPDERRPTTVHAVAFTVPEDNGPSERNWSGDAVEGARATTCEVPDWPGPFVPPPRNLSHAYREAIDDIHRARGTTPSSGRYPTEVQEKAFWAFFSALSDACIAIIADHHPHGAWKHNYPSSDNMHRMHVIGSAPGSGKTTLAKAFAIALTRVTGTSPYPFGCVFMVHHIATAEGVFQELSKLLPPDSVAVFSTKHDADEPWPDYSSTFSVYDLERYPVIIVTHEFYTGIRAEKARIYTRNGLTFPRVVTFIDEKANEIAVYDVDPVSLERVLEFVQRDRQAPRGVLDGLLKLVDFASQKRRHREQGIETPAHDRAGWQAAVEATTYLRCDEAARYARSASARKPTLDFDDVFGFANAMGEDMAFISRGNKGVINFVGYERALPRVPGMVLLDATADIDAITNICSWRKHAELPPERYDLLEIIHVPSVATGNLRRWLSEKWENMYAYVAQIKDLVCRHVPVGGRALVVCMKPVAVAQGILGWSEHMQPFVNRTTPEAPDSLISKNEFTEDRAWSLNGRLVSVTWFGGYGIGANVWRDADVVIICDDFHLPQRAIKATLQGLRGHKASEGLLAVPGNLWSEELECLRDGHILRWMKQMALRGKARDMDEEGVCGHQKLVITGDLVRLLGHRPKVFPGAKITAKHSDDGHWLDRLAYLLLSGDLPEEVSTKVIGEKLGVRWGDISGHLTSHKLFREVVEGAGWAYHRGIGRRAGCFKRATERMASE
jgi:hypothetical protein